MTADTQAKADAVPLAGRKIVLADDGEVRRRLGHIIRERSFGRGRIKLASGRESDFLGAGVASADSLAWLLDCWQAASPRQAVTPARMRILRMNHLPALS